jgi:hypothetical protein
MLVAVTALSFANAWPDEVVLDDKFFVNNQQLPDWTEPAELFRGDVWRTVGAKSGLYRPALLLSLSLDSQLFGGWLPGYHLSNILLHLLVTLLVYGFLRHLLQTTPQPTARPDLYALLAALVFAVHPVHTEVVNSVFNRSDMLVSLGAVAGLWWLLHFLEARPARAWAGLAIAYLFAMLSKENAVVIPGLAVILILLLPAENWGQRIRRSVPVLWMLLPLGLYLYLRAHALATGAAEAGAGIAPVTEMVSEIRFTGQEYLVDLAGNWGIGLKLMVWPYPLQLNYPPLPTATAVAMIGGQLALIGVGLAQLRRGRSALLTGLAWFYLALLPASRLFTPGEEEPHLAERYLYLPSIGAALVLVFALAWLGSRLGPRRVAALILAIVAVMMPLTWIRNNEWAPTCACSRLSIAAAGRRRIRYVTSPAALSAGATAPAQRKSATGTPTLSGFTRDSLVTADRPMLRSHVPRTPRRPFWLRSRRGATLRRPTTLPCCTSPRAAGWTPSCNSSKRSTWRTTPPSKTCAGDFSSRTSSPRTRKAWPKPRIFSRKPTGWSRC